MPIVADLEDLSGAELLMTLALNRKTGRLTAESGTDRVVLAIREGSIVYAASTGAREAIGAMLVRRGLIRQVELEEALSRQRAASRTTHLGNILVEMGALSQHELDHVVLLQFRDALRPFLSWSRGVASFERMAIPDLGAVHVDAREIVLESGLSTEQLVLDGMTELEDAGRGAAPDVASMLAELADMSLSVTSEMAVLILDQAARIARRALLLLVHADGFRVVDGFGEDPDGARLAAAEYWLHRGEPGDSLLERAAATARPARGAVSRSGGDRLLLEVLGGEPPLEAIALPVVVGAAVVALLWVDSGDRSTPLADPADLEAVLAAVAADIGRVGPGGARA